jgi:hypothetical protein
MRVLARRLSGRAHRGRRAGVAAVSPRDYSRSIADDRYFHRTLRPRTVQRPPLPGNVARRGELSRERRPWGLSFHDVPERTVEDCSIARLPECRILPFRNRWGSVFHAVVSRDGRPLRIHGTRFPEDAQPLGEGPAVDFGEAAWVMGRWHRNYYHWLLYHLPRIMVLQDHGAERRVLIPGPGPLRPVIEASLSALGVDPAGLRAAVAGPMRADPLWIVEADRFDPVLLRELRKRIAGNPGAPARRVYVSRERTARRRLTNPEAVLGPLGRAGFDAVRTEEMTFAEQVALASRTEILVGVHGAGLTNMLFMPEGAHVVELANPRYPSPAFYALAAALGLRYWLVRGKPREERGPDSLDVEVDPRDVEAVIAAIERDR